MYVGNQYNFSNIKKKDIKQNLTYLINCKVWVNGYWAWSFVYGQRINSHNTRKEHHNSSIHVGFKFKYLQDYYAVEMVASLYIVFVAWGLSLQYRRFKIPPMCWGVSKTRNCLFGNRVWFIHIKYACHSLIT